MAYNRRDFLLQALESTVNQTLSKDKYEIICVKNFKDHRIDAYIRKNHIIPILKERSTIGGSLYMSLKQAKGNVIAFLDDDDLFNKYKLQKVFDVFKDPDVGLYHNEIIKGEKPRSIWEKSAAVRSKTLRIRYPYHKKYYDTLYAVGNSSSIAIKKEIVKGHLHEIKRIRASPDSFMLLLALINKKTVLIDESRLTFCRVHNDNTGSPKALDKHIAYLAKLEIPAYIYQLGLAERYNSYAAIEIFHALLFGKTSWIGIASYAESKKLISDFFKYLPKRGFTKMVAKIAVLDILHILGSDFPHKRITSEIGKS